MERYLISRILQGIVTLFITSVIIFGLVRLTGNPLDVILPEDATMEEYKEMSIQLGLDKPLPVQYWIFMKNISHGDWGKSIIYKSSVLKIIISRFPATIRLALAASIISFLIALPTGVIAAVYWNRWQDTLAKTFAMIGQSLPSFWLGIILIQMFSVKFGLLPAGGYESNNILFWILPAFTLGYHSTAGVLRLTRSAMLDILSSDFVRLARIKGASEMLVIWKHALRNALIPVVTFSGLIYTYMLMGSVITETIFAWAGVGRLAFLAIKGRDFPLIQGIVIIFVALYIVFNLLIDILYVYIDPRIRYTK